MLRLVQIAHRTYGRHVAVVDEPRLRLLPEFSCTYELAQRAIEQKKRIAEVIAADPPKESVDYEPIYRGGSGWTLLPPFHHPQDAAHCLITGTGLTHRASADNRQAMHVTETRSAESSAAAVETDSMKMYRIGLDGGRPAAECVGASPEWFFKGTGTIVRSHNQPLDVPPHAEDGGEEAEIAGVYLNGSDGTPYRVGLTQGNEFSDHVMESRNYLYLAQSKLRSCAFGPELVVDGDFSEVRGKSWIERDGKVIWEGALASGEKNMCHSLANMEHHHFKHEEHRRAGDVHYHFFGADLFSFKDRLKLLDHDVMVVAFENFGRPLRNSVRIDRSEMKPISVKAL